MTKKIIFTTGGTGGHILPAQNLMKHFSDQGYEVLLITDKRGKNFISSYPKLKSYILTAGTPTNKKIINKILSFFIIFYSLIKSALILKKVKADLVIGFGGYVSFPVCFLSKLFNLPLIIYENNLILGRANKYLLFFAKKVFTAKKIKENFPNRYKNKIIEVGPILNKNIINFSNSEKNKNKNKFFFSILVLGGSQGAEIFGKISPTVIKMIKEKGYSIEIIQQCVKKQKQTLIEFYEKHNVKNYVFEFDANILKSILSSDLAITRCGASTTAELTHTLTPFIAVPLPNSIDDHQYLNAKFYKEKGCCWVLEQKDFNTENLFNLVMEIIKNKNKLEDVRGNMKKICSHNVYSAIENEIKKII